MVQIISDRQSDWVNWFGGVIERLEKTPSISRIVVVAEADDDSNTQIIEFMNCNTDDVFYLGGVLQKEATKHELARELGLDDDYWEEEFDEYDEEEVE